MNSLKKNIAFFLLLIPIIAVCQITNFSEKFDLPEEVKETSGLIFFNAKIITHNDSGDDANLYEIDSLSGLITRTISITNATNVDWEDITQDDTHIYIGDIGNNNGNRQDLTIYKILKTDYLNNNSVTAEIISFSYEDQTDFSVQPNSSNFDAEAISIYQGQVFIFTKNWADLMTNVYSIPITSGTHTAIKVSSFNVAGLITGSDYNSSDDSFMLSGYDDTLTPFLILIDHNRPPGNDIFSDGAQKIFLIVELGQGNQVEGITHYDGGNYYISREHFTTTVNGNEVIITQKLFQFFNVAFQLLSVNEYHLDSEILLYPNPSQDVITVKSQNPLYNISRIEVFNTMGVKIKQVSSISLNIEELPSGFYLLKIVLDNEKSVFKKVLKI
jgi:hypothetical protein